MGLRPRKSIEHGIALGNIIDAPAAPRPATQQTQHGKQPALECAISFKRLNGIVRATWVILATGRCVCGNVALVPAHSRNQHRPEGKSHDSSRLPCHRSESLGDLLVQRREIRGRGARLGAQYDIAPLRKQMLVGPGRYPEPTFHRIARDRFADRFGYGQSQTPVIRRLFLIANPVGHQIVHDDILASHLAPALEHGDKITMAL